MLAACVRLLAGIHPSVMLSLDAAGKVGRETFLMRPQAKHVNGSQRDRIREAAKNSARAIRTYFYSDHDEMIVRSLEDFAHTIIEIIEENEPNPPR
jgi:hypothetical protein